MISKNLAYFFVFPDMFCTFAPMETKNKILSEKKIYEGLLNEDKSVIEAFFSNKKFQTVIGIIQAKILKDRKEGSAKAEIYNELYYLLLRNDKAKLREFNPEELRKKGSFLTWLARTFIKYYQSKRKDRLKKKRDHQEKLARHEALTQDHDINNKKNINDPEADLEDKEYIENVKMVISIMEDPKNKKRNPHYAEIMRKELLDEDMLLSFESSNLSQETERAKKAFWKLYTKLEKKGEI